MTSVALWVTLVAYAAGTGMGVHHYHLCELNGDL